MAEPSSENPLQNQDTYSDLRGRVTQVLVSGQKQIESLKVEIYWKTGRLIQEHLMNHPEEVGYGKQVIEKLSRDLGIERTVFYRILKFAQNFPSIAARQHLTWTHYRELLAVSDPSQRNLLEREAEAGKWPVRRLILEIKKQTQKERVVEAELEIEQLDEPKQITPGVRRVGWLQKLNGKKEKVVDLGFDTYQPLSSKDVPKYKVDETVVWSESQRAWISGGTVEELYTYEGEIERVVDGDTLLVHVELGGGMVRRQYLRLRGIDAESLKTAKGKQAQRFVEELAKKNTRVRFKSRFRDQYDRYLSDVWIGKTYLNQALLDKGFAEKVTPKHD